MKNPFYKFQLETRLLTINIHQISCYGNNADGSLVVWMSDSEGELVIPNFSVNDMDFLLARHFGHNHAYDEVKEVVDVINI